MKKLDVEEWKKSSEQGEVCGILGCIANPTTRCKHCGNFYCDEHKIVIGTVAHSQMEVTVDSKQGKIHLSVNDDGIILEDCTKFGTSECDECKHRFKCFTQRSLGGKIQLGMPLKSIMDILKYTGEENETASKRIHRTTEP